MPTNLPPEYFDAEKRLKQAVTPHEKIAALEELISTVPKHKGTDRLRADLRKKLSQLREDAVRRKKSGRGDLYTIEKQGAAQAALVGLANSGKSSVLKALTKAHPVIADYPLSTLTPVAGMMLYEDIQFQLIDLPPVGNEPTDGWVSCILKNADILLLIIDLLEDPEVQADLLLELLAGWKITLAELCEGRAGKEKGVAKPAVIAGNKGDLPGTESRLEKLLRKFTDTYAVTGVSATTGEGMEDFRNAIFQSSSIIRVYSKQPGKVPDRETPFVLRRGATVLDLAELIHRDFLEHFQYACIWGSAKFDGQRVQKDHVLHDRDVVEYHVK